MNDPKDRDDQHVDQEPREFRAENFHIEAPSGLDLHPEPRRVVRVSKRASMAIVGIGVALLLAFAYGGYRRAARAQVAAREAGLPTSVAPATQASREFTSSIPTGTVPLERTDPNKLQPPDASSERVNESASSCGTDSQTNEPYRYNPQTGQPCGGFRPKQMVVNRAPVMQQPTEPSAVQTQPTAEEQRLAAAYEREQEAELAPTGIRDSAPSNGASFNAVSADLSAPPTDADLSQISGLSQALRDAVNRSASSRDFAQKPTSAGGDFDRQNMQNTKEAFLASKRNPQRDDYLQSTRMAPLSRYEIKAGWEIPAVLEQSLNSDLPGELKALVTSNVYDTATGMYLLIPQGSRLIGKYDSRLSYAQDGVQVAWNRLIFPDASSVDLDGMVGLDSHGNAGLRDKVDHHYKRLIGFSALTSMFTAAFAVSQRANQSVLAYPTPGQAASQAVGQELSETGAQMTRRNLDVQPTIKVRAGYQFTVRVNRDILFDAPYEPMQAETPRSLAANAK